MQFSRGVSTITATVQPQIIKESHLQPIWHVIVLNVLTVGFYALVWFFKTARVLSNRANDLLERPSESAPYLAPPKLAELTEQEINSLDLIKRVPPFFLMLGILLPIINFFLGFFFFKMIAELYPDRTSFIRAQPALIGLGLSVALVGSTWLARLPHLYFLLYCVGVCVPLCIGQHLLNCYWRQIELDDDLLVRHSFSTSELVMLILGIVLLGLIIAGFFVTPMQPAPILSP
ncbi:MAG TPA: DUF4234 domain-containing protein [Oculatellaceae cyanobacterium]